MKRREFPDFFESILVIDQSIPLLTYHYARILHLVNQFELNKSILSKIEMEKLILDQTQNLNSPSIKAKCTLSVENDILTFKYIECTTIDLMNSKDETPVKLVIYPEGFKDSNSLLSNCKVASKFLYQDSLDYAKKQGCDQSIILNERNEVVETSICNIFFQKDQRTFTPPLSSGCVNGIMRHILMQNNEVIEKIVKVNELANFDSIYLTNAVRGVIKANIVSGNGIL